MYAKIVFRALSCVAVYGCAIAASLAEEPPAKLLDLSNWRLTLPVDTELPGTPDEIAQPQLSTFVHADYFYRDDTRKAVVFRAHCGGRTTKGSGFPRSELREMTSDGTRRAAWSTEDQTLHTMTARIAITATPLKKPHVVCAQIHDADDDLMMIRLEGTKLFVERNSFGDVSLTRNYQLGTPFDLKILAGGGEVMVWFDGELKMRWPVAKSGCYFKAGCYTQSNASKGDEPSAFGEVVLYALKVEHAGHADENGT